MTRLASKIHGQYYPIPPQVIPIICKQLSTPDKGRWTILDPCAGEAMALTQLSTDLSCDPRDVYGCELSPQLGDNARENLPKGSNFISPADFFNLSCTSKSISLLFLNPPFQESMEHGRAEFEFLKLATEKLCIGGVLVFVIPQATAERWDVQKYMVHNYESMYTTPFPEKYRKFKEVIVFGVRVDTSKDKRLPWKMTWTDQCSLDPVSYQIPACKGPASFRKVMLTDNEILDMTARSSAVSILRVTDDPPLARPPLALGEGHIALLVASGHLDGLIEPPNESSHVVRGMSKKVEFIDDVEESQDEDSGTLKTVTVLKQRIVIAVRAIGKDGVIKSFTDQKEHERDIGETKFDVPAEDSTGSDGGIDETDEIEGDNDNE